MLYLIIDKGSFEKEYENAIKNKNLQRVESLLIFNKALNFFGYNINYKINPESILK